jgi:membrane-associated phospholipid phosphatase
MTRVRPVEWVLLGFLVFVALKAGARALAEWREVLWSRTLDIFFALALVELVSLARPVWAGWAKTPPGARRFLLGLLPLAAAPMALALFGVLHSKLATTFSALRPAEAVVVVMITTLRISGFGLPTAFLWLLAARDAQQHGELVARRVGVSAGRLLWQNTRDWGPILLILAGYWWSASETGVVGRDAVMEGLDRALLFGNDLFAVLARVTTRPLSEWFAFVYTFYAALFPLVASAVRWRAGRAALQETFFALGLAFLVAYVSYTLIPVKGPLLYRTFDVPVELELFAPLKQALMDDTRVTWDCFPSMHTAATLLMGWQLWRRARGLFWALLPVLVSIPCACIYLRYHWLTDVLAGIALAVVIARVTVRVSAAPGP